MSIWVFLKAVSKAKYILTIKICVKNLRKYYK